MNGRESGARTSFQTVTMLMAIPLCGMAIFFVWQWFHGGITPREVVAEIRAIGAPASAAPMPHRPQRSEGDDGRIAAPLPEHADALPKVTRRKHRGDIVLIIDDLGFDGQPLERLMALDPNVNVAILPNGTRATEFANRLNARGFEVLCHLPMQPRGREVPGANAILTSMSDDEIAQATRENILAVPHARGVNNHMGSLATTDRRVMTSVLGALPEGMYFVDSRTAVASIAANVAREMNVRTATRNVFLDDVASERAVRKQLADLAAAAEKKGVAIGIGHPYPVTMRVLAEEMPQLRTQGFRFVRASQVVR